jgi:predicted nucleotidyltransferase
MEQSENDLDLVIYNDEQRWWVNIKDNCITTIKQFEESIKLQKEIEILAEQKIEELGKI